MHAEPTPQHVKKRRREPKPLTARRLRRKLWRGLLICLLLLVVAVFVLTRTGVTRHLVLPRLSSALNLDIQADSVIVASDLSVEIRNARLRIPGVAGPAGELLRIDSLVARLDWLRLPSPSAVRGIDLDRPRLRISQETESGHVNVASLAIFGRVRGGEVSTLPTVVVRNGTLELGEHAGDSYTQLTGVPFSGVLASQPGDETGRSFFSLTPAVGESGVEVMGLVDQSGVRFTLGRFTLENWSVEHVPSRWRDLWARLNLDGRVVPRQVTVSPSGEVQFEVVLDGVAVTLPFADESKSARLTGVNGRFFVTDGAVSAELEGRVGPMSQRVVFDIWGFDPVSSPFLARLTTDPFRLERDLELLDYVPDFAHDKNEMFGFPEGDVDATIWLARGAPPPGAPALMTGRLEPPGAIARAENGNGQIRLEGLLRMSNGRAAYRGFPYPFAAMSAHFRFNRERLWIENLRGTGPTGATLSGSGVIGPLGETAAVDLDLRVEGLPVDEVLASAMSEDRRELLRSLFSREKYDALVADGLLRSSEDAAPLLERLESIESEREAWSTTGIGTAELDRLDTEQREIRAALERLPAFSLGGNADATVRVIRHEGLESRWERDIRLVFDEVGLLSDFFALPAIGRRVEFTMTDLMAVFRVDQGRTLRGGDVSIEARMPILDDGPGTVPEVTITASGVPIDDLLIRAISGPDTHTQGPGELARLLGRLNLSGKLESTATIGPESGRVGYHINSTLAGVGMSLAESGVRFDGVRGHVVVDPDRVGLDLTGTLSSTDSPGRVEAARLHAEIAVPEGRTWTDRDEPRITPTLRADVTLPAADVRIPLERVVGVFDAPTAERVAELREQYRPEGVIDIESSIHGPIGDKPAGAMDIAVAVTGIDRLGFDAAGMRITASEGRGRALIHPGRTPSAEFQGFSVELEADGVRSGRLSLDDAIPLDDRRDQAVWGLSLAGGSFESPLTRDAVARSAPGGFAGLFESYEPRGRFDLELVHKPGGVFEGVLSPGSLTLSTPRGDAVFRSASGTVRFASGGGTIEGVTLEDEDRRVGLDGAWRPGERGTRVELDLDVEADTLDGPLLGLVPPQLGEVFDALRISVDEGLVAESLRLELDADDAGVGAFAASGVVNIQNGRLEVGVPVTELVGSLAFQAHRTDADTDPVYSLSLDAQRWRMFGLRMTNGRAEIISGREPGSVLVPTLHANAHGGRFSGAFRVSAEKDGSRVYRGDIQLAEVRLAPLLEDVKVGEEATLAEEVRVGIESVYDAGLWDQARDRSRGLVNASFSITGPLEEGAGGRRGRGRVIVGGGPVVLIPLIIPLIEFSNLQMPLGDELRIALANLYLDDRGVMFEDIAVLSDSIELLGYGEMSWPGAELDLRVRSQGNLRIPVVSAMVETVRDELFITRLRGPLTDPVISTESFTATRRVMGSLFGGEDNPNRVRLLEISQSAGTAGQRIRRAAELLDRIGAGQVSPAARVGNDAP